MSLGSWLGDRCCFAVPTKPYPLVALQLLEVHGAGDGHRRAVAVQVAFERQTLKPVFHFIGAKVETTWVGTRCLSAVGQGESTCTAPPGARAASWPTARQIQHAPTSPGSSFVVILKKILSWSFDQSVSWCRVCSDVWVWVYIVCVVSVYVRWWCNAVVCVVCGVCVRAVRVCMCGVAHAEASQPCKRGREDFQLLHPYHRTAA
jgi:hypothetical protein